MKRSDLGVPVVLLPVFVVVSCFAFAQVSASSPQASPPTTEDPSNVPTAPPLATNAPRMERQTRLQIIRDFETQLVYSRTPFPMGTKGLQLKQGVITPNGEDLKQALALFGPALKPGDPAHISLVQIKDGYIHFEINGGPIRHKKWYQRIQVSGAQGPVNNTQRPDDPENNPHGSFVNLYFDKYVPELTPAQLRTMLYPVLDFNARNPEQAYLDTMPPKVKQAIQAHHVLVGMNTEMVIHAKGKPPKKVREREGEVSYEEWIYGEPPADVDFVRVVNSEVVRVETMRMSGEKIVRTEKEVILEPAEDKEKEAKREEGDRPANAPSLRRPGEDAGDAPQPAKGAAPPPPYIPPPPPHPGSGPGQLIALAE
ncbi:MAG TPA: hypothetical protein VND65_03195 [Candidatus Binatia bacterium]|nr:hypothetical protein [Candidatus Binatia bacterium]